MDMLKGFWRDERGLETAEYAVMTALIVAALVGVVTALSGAIQNRIGQVKDTIAGIPN